MRRRTPQPPTNPPEPSPSSSEHEFEPPHCELDGVGSDADVDEPLVSVWETSSCFRDGCDAQRQYCYSFDYTDADDRTQQIIRETVRRSDVYDSGAQYAAEHAEMVDYDDGPVVAIRVGDDTVGYIYPHYADNNSSHASGPCYGEIDEATRLGI